MRLAATHTTRYLYSEFVSLCHSETHLAPRACRRQAIVSYALEVLPEPQALVDRTDYFGNGVSSFTLNEPHRELVITSRLVADVVQEPPPDFTLSAPWEDVRKAVEERASDEAFEACQFVYASPHVKKGAAFADYAAPSFPPGRRFLEGVGDLSHRIFAEFEYDPRATTVATPVDEVLRSRRGVCQDFAHLMISCLRSLELPARYVSGYVRTVGSLIGGDASHAWIAAWCPVLGWQDFDPTNDVTPQGDHLTLGWGRDYSDVAPVKGVARGGREHVISVSVELTQM